MSDGDTGMRATQAFFVPDTKCMLEDHSLEIPPFLRRSANGGFQNPHLAVPLIPVAGASGERYRPVTAERDPEAERRAAAAERDRRAREAIRRAEVEEERARAKQHSLAAAHQRRLDKERKQQIQLAQRKNFLAHFRWEFDK